MFYNKERYWNDCSEIYKTLIDIYNYPKNHIYVIMSDGTSPNIDRSLLNGNHDSSPLDLDGDGENDIQYAATKAIIMNVFTSLGSTLNSDDALFVYVTDHGGLENGHSYLYLWDDEIMYDNEFATELNKVNAGIVITCMAQCHSGGFIDHLEASKRVIATACKKNEVSFPTTDEVYDEFAYHWTSAVRGITPDGVSVNADTNNDGIVSMHEAFNYATSHDTKSEHPQYSSTPSAWGDFVSLSENIITGDSIIAAYGVYQVKPSTSLTTVWSIDNNSFSLTPSGHKCTVSYDQGNQYDTATMTATVMKDGVVLKTLTKQIENVGKIMGDGVLCSPNLYSRAALPSEFSATWSIDNSAFSITPSGNQCTVSYNNSPQYDEATLTATISKNGTTVATLDKRIVMHGTNMYVEGEQSGIYDANGDIPAVGMTFTIPASSGNRKMRRISAAVRRDSVEMRQMPVVFERMQTRSLNDNPQYGITEIYGGADITLYGSRFDGMNISFSGEEQPDYLMLGGDTIVRFRMPEVSSITYHDGYYYVVLHATSEGGCHDFDLWFKVIPVDGEAIGDPEISLYFSGNTMRVDFDAVEWEELPSGMIQVVPWYLSIYRMETGTRVHYSTNYTGSKAVDTSTWSPGIYSIRIDTNGNRYTKKFILQ
ncbi:MAG: T9SS type A sorting domain-containing protein [Prevotella sp.]|nr:T9SS type A sorting domain-containing protein [Prevotella sp.]